MGCEAGQCKTSTPKGIFIVTPSLKGWPTKAKEAPTTTEFCSHALTEYQAMSSTCTQSQLSTATLVSLFVQCHISFRYIYIYILLEQCGTVLVLYINLFI